MRNYYLIFERHRCRILKLSLEEYLKFMSNKNPDFKNLILRDFHGVKYKYLGKNYCIKI